MKGEQAIVREIASMISIVACCHGAKLCAHAARDFRLQHHQDSRFLPRAIRRSVGTFARLIGSAFAFSKVNPSRDCHLPTHQILIGHTGISARAYFLRLNNISHVAAGRTMCHAGTKSARTSIAPLSEPQWGLPLTEPPHPYSLDYNRRSRSDRRKLSTGVTFKFWQEQESVW